MRRAAILESAILPLAIAGALLLGCGPSTPAASSAPRGCGSDDDCKGARICVTQRCVDPPAEAQTPPATSTTPPASASAPPTATTVAEPAPPAPSPDPATPPAPAEAASGERPPPGCGCARDDLMCAMKCAQKGNAIGPGTGDTSCDCPPGDLLCGMRCK